KTPQAMTAGGHFSNHLPGWKMHACGHHLRQGGVAEMTSQAERSIRRSGDYRKAVFQILARHLRSCAGFIRYIKNACQRYAPVEWWIRARCHKVTIQLRQESAFRPIPRFLTSL
ncbi:MAG: hypothetical protein ACI4BC_07305, partial [Muribaculaceae bacterium]